jgi:hypothetical protein
LKQYNPEEEDYHHQAKGYLCANDEPSRRPTMPSPSRTIRCYGFPLSGHSHRV